MEFSKVKIIDNMPVVIVIAALLLNILIGINNNISFTALMIRCIVVTIIFGVFGYIVTETIKNAVECSKLGKHCHNADGEQTGSNESGVDNKPILDIKVPPLDDKEFIGIDNDSDDEFVEVNPVFMGSYREDNQDQQ